MLNIVCWIAFLFVCPSESLNDTIDFNITLPTWPNSLVIGGINSIIRESIVRFVYAEAEQALKENGIVPWDLEFSYHFTNSCDDFKTLREMMYLYDTFNPDAFIGPENTNCMIVAALFAAVKQKPIIGCGPISDLLTDKNTYKTLSRVTFTMGPMGDAIGRLVKNYKWQQVAIIRSAADAMCTVSLSGVYKIFALYNITVTKEIYAEKDNINDIRKALQSFKSIARIAILCFGLNSVTAANFTLEAYKMGMISPEYVYILPCYHRDKYYDWRPWIEFPYNDSTVEMLKKSYQGALVIQDFAQELGQKYRRHVEAEMNLLLNNFELNLVAKLYDALYLIGLAYNISIESGFDYRNATQLVKIIGDCQFKGASGSIVLNTDRDRIPDYIVFGQNAAKTDMEQMMLIESIKYPNRTFSFVIHETRLYNWGTEGNQVPPDVPICGLLNEFCQKDQTVIIAASVLSSFTVIIACGIAAYYYRKSQYNKEVLRRSWEINPDDLINAFKNLARNGSIRSVSSAHTVLSNGLNTTVDNMDDDYYLLQRTELTAAYKGQMVVYNKIEKRGIIKLNTSQLIMLKQLRDVDHENLNRFVGAQFEKTSDVFIVWTYYTKGPLTHLLYNEHVQLDMTFKSSFIRDIVLGLDYLHNKSHIGFHGDLSGITCYIDDRFTIKLTAFGMRKFFRSLVETGCNTTELVNAYAQHFHYLSPEILQGDNNVDDKACDVYSFAIMAYQILFRVIPYEVLDKFADEEIIHRVINDDLRPEITKEMEQSGSSKFCQLIRHCWVGDWKSRPTIHEIKRTVVTATKQYGNNLMDHVLRMMEMYANNMEKLVEERTKQLNEERKKSDNLLSQLLPASVATVLKRGESVIPQSYEAVTIYFSDIVGFTTLCSQCTPMEVVTFLNSLYTQIDGLINSYDVYKVETIGDAYMIVSGLPELNGDKHSTEITNLALAVLEVLKTYTVPHIPGRQIQMRIGLHTGPVVAGVVGLKMPRYCLFGDTVNVASRMESTGQPGKIQISSALEVLLRRFAVYCIQLHGEIPVKGKGLCTTYFLTKSP